MPSSQAIRFSLQVCQLYTCNAIFVHFASRLTIIGCGRFFEGNAEQMHKALNETLASLPDDTKVYVRKKTVKKI